LPPKIGCELELILLLSRTREARVSASSSVAKLASRVDYDELTRILTIRRLLPLIGGRLIECAAGVVPPGFVAAVESAHHSARAAGMAVEVQTADAIELLAGHGIASMPQKGVALAEAAHGDVGLRRSGDIDLLVRPEQLHAAVAALMAVGYSAPADPLGPDGMPSLHLRLDHPQRLPIEVHWRIHWYEQQFSRDLLERRTPVDIAAALLLMYARDGFYGVRLSADVAGYWDRHRDEIGRGALDQHAQRYPELARAWWTAALVAEQVAAVPAGTWFSNRPTLNRRAQLAARLANWSQSGDRDQLIANIGLVDALLAPADELPSVIRRELRSMPSGPAAHGAKTAVRWIAALGRTSLGSWAPLPASVS
jgi:hypothetical protein